MKFTIVFLVCIALSACKLFTSPANEVKIAGGQVVSNWNYLDVVRVVTDAKNNITCAGVVVSKNSLIMPAHCYRKDAQSPGNFYAIFKDVFHYPKHIELFRGVADTTTLNREAAKRDIAVVIFQSDIFQSIPITPIRKTPLKVGEKFRILGFGSDSFDANKAKISSSKQELRIGYNTIFSASSDLNYSFFKFEKDASGKILYQNAKALAAPGDSGGPIFDDKGQIVGFAVGIYFLKRNGKSDTGKYNYAEMIDKDGKPHLDTKNAVFAVNVMVGMTPESQAAKIIMSANLKGAKISYPSSDIVFTNEDRSWMGGSLTSNPKPVKGSWVALAAGYEYLSDSTETVESLGDLKTVSVPSGSGLPSHPQIGPDSNDFEAEEEFSILIKPDESEETVATAEQERIKQEQDRLFLAGKQVYEKNCERCHAGQEDERQYLEAIKPGKGNAGMQAVMQNLQRDKDSLAALKVFLDKSNTK